MLILQMYLLLQTMPVEDEDKYDFDPLDVTKIWPEQLFPLQPVGRMVLNKNPDNFFTENEQLAFCPALVVPGVAQTYLFRVCSMYAVEADTADCARVLLQCCVAWKCVSSCRTQRERVPCLGRMHDDPLGFHSI